MSKNMLVLKNITFKPTDIRSVIKEEKEGYASGLLSKHTTIDIHSDLPNEIIKMSVVEIIS